MSCIGTSCAFRGCWWRRGPRGFGCEAARRRRRSAEVIVGGGGPQRGRTPSRLLAKDAVELGVAAEAGLERGGQRRRALPFAVETQETLQSLLIAEPADRNAGLLLEY